MPRLAIVGRAAAAALVSLATLTLGTAAYAADAETRNVVLAGARVSNVSAARVVVTMEASGDLRGLLTLTLDRVDGHLAGEWALVVRYLQDFDDDGNPTAPDFDHSDGEPHEHFQLVDKGTLSGPIADGALATDAEGTITGVTVQLGVSEGSLTFQGAAGSGWAAATVINDIHVSTGTLTLTF
jgi:hypothetical protein